MADRHIDYDEVSEYGEHFIAALPTIAGQSDLVDITKLDALVSGAMRAVQTELQNASGDRSTLRVERADTAAGAAAVRDVLSRFYYFLRSLPSSVASDFGALFPGQTMGELGHLKPADLEAKAASVLRGFDSDANRNVAALAPWKTEIAAARDTLANALSGKGSAQGQSFTATAALIEARKNFLHAYNKVAKPLIRGVLAQLGRENEYAQFFKDLTVNE